MAIGLYNLAGAWRWGWGKAENWVPITFCLLEWSFQITLSRGLAKTVRGPARHATVQYTMYELVSITSWLSSSPCGGCSTTGVVQYGSSSQE